MRPKSILIDPVDADADGLAQVQTSTSGGSVTLNGALIIDSAFKADYPRRIGVLSSGDDSGVTITVTGTYDTKAITEDITGTTGGASTSDTTLYFDTITDISLSGAAAANISAGTLDEFATNTIPIETSNSDPATVSLESFSGTISAKVQETYSRIQYDDIEYVDSPLTSTSSAAASDMSNHASGVRFVANSYSSGAELRMVINQDRKF
jgi:hypothetical protein